VIAMLLAIGALAAEAEPDRGLAEGRYVMTIHAASRTRVPVLGWTPSVTVSDMIVEVRRSEGGWSQRQQVCDVRVESHQKRGTTTIPDAFVAALPAKRYPVAVARGPEGWTYRADLGVDHVGYDPEVTDEVPSDVDDPGVIDSDNDGFPGATVRLSVPVFGDADLYVAQRGSMELVGTIGPDGGVRGRVVVDQLEQRTLGATHWMFKGSPRIEPVAEESWFTMRPAPDAACDDLGRT